MSSERSHLSLGFFICHVCFSNPSLQGCRYRCLKVCREATYYCCGDPAESRCHPHPGPDAGAPSIPGLSISLSSALEKVRQNPRSWNVSVAANRVLKARQGDASPMTAWHFDQPGQCLSSGRGAIGAQKSSVPLQGPPWTVGCSCVGQSLAPWAPC